MASDTMPRTATDRYTIISADCHAGASHAVYREYLERDLLEDFDAWRTRYRNPYRDLGDQRRLRNWDNDLRNGAQEGDGVVGEVVFPNTVPPFFPSFVLFAQPPEPPDYRHRLAGIRAHNRWLVDWCGEFAPRRAGVGQIFLNDVDDAIADVEWIASHALRGGILLPNVAPDVKWVKPLYDPYYDPLWKVCEDLGVPVNVHSGTGNPDYGRYPISQVLYINEVGFYSQRPLVQFIVSGVFERFPRLRFVLTEIGCAWIPDLLRRLDATMAQIRATGETGEIKYAAGLLPAGSATEYFRRNCWIGVSGPGAADVAARHDIGIDRFMWGSDYPHDEGTHPHTREHLRRRFHAVDPDEVRMMLAENAAALYDFDLAALAPLAARVGPTVAEIATPVDGDDEPVITGLSKDMDARAV
jgi:predicted TIM-barrel fold metal-dependent hydrolase